MHSYTIHDFFKVDIIGWTRTQDQLNWAGHPALLVNLIAGVHAGQSPNHNLENLEDITRELHEVVKEFLLA